MKRKLMSLEFMTRQGLCEFINETSIKEGDIQQIICFNNSYYTAFVIFFWTDKVKGVKQNAT